MAETGKSKEKSVETRSPARWDPLAEWESLANWPFRGAALPSRALEGVWGQGGRFAPAIDVSEADGHYTITAELPGVSKDDVTVEVHDGVLTIRGEKRSEREEKGEHGRHFERTFGAFSRSFTLPANADADHIDAKFQDGILTVEVKKSEAAKPKTVAIKS
jgi:HSP20 family protein